MDRQADRQMMLLMGIYFISIFRTPSLFKSKREDVEQAQWGKMNTTKPGDLSSILRAHTVGGEKVLPQAVL